MSIYATLWALKFPRFGEYHSGCEWVTVLAQGVPAHVGSEGPDAYGSFLPPVPESIADHVRAVVFVTMGAEKGTDRSTQEYVAPLLVLPGAEYASMMDPRPRYQVLENMGIDHAIDSDPLQAPLALARASSRTLAAAQASNQIVAGANHGPCITNQDLTEFAVGSGQWAARSLQWAVCSLQQEVWNCCQLSTANCQLSFNGFLRRP